MVLLFGCQSLMCHQTLLLEKNRVLIFLAQLPPITLPPRTVARFISEYSKMNFYKMQKLILRKLYYRMDHISQSICFDIRFSLNSHLICSEFIIFYSINIFAASKCLLFDTLFKKFLKEIYRTLLLLAAAMYNS